MLLIVLALSAFSLSYYATEAVQAHGTHCNSYAPLFCERYYSVQKRCCSYGIQGKIKSADVNLVSPSTDYTAHWMGITGVTPPGVPANQWVQMGFNEGIDPDGGIPSTPEVYTEFRRIPCGNAYDFQAHGTFGTLWDHMFVYYTGTYITTTCPPPEPNTTLYRFAMKRGSMSNPILGTGWLQAPYGLFDAESERGNWHAIEPNGTQCFGTNNNESCTASTTYGLKTYDYAQNQWALWTATPSITHNDPPYNRVTLANHYSWYSSGQP